METMTHKIQIDSEVTECGDGCCTTFWDILLIDGVEVARTQHMETERLIIAALKHFNIEAE